MNITEFFTGKKDKSKSKAASTPDTNDHNEVSDSSERISISRSDGVTHDIISVFAKTGMAAATRESISKKSPSMEQLQIQGQSQPDEHEHITISRSDARMHDITKYVNSGGGATGGSEKVDETGRSLSTSKIGIQFIQQALSKDNRRTQSIDEPTAILNAGRRTLSVSDMLLKPKVVRIAHMSDSYNMLVKSRKKSFYPAADILVHSGNFTINGTKEEFEEFNEWLGSVKTIYHYRLVVVGSRDVKKFGADWAKYKKMLPNASHVLCHEEVIFLGLRFYGCPWHFGHKSNYTVRPLAPSNTSGRFEDIPIGIDVLISHAPAYQRLDRTQEGENWGAHDLVDALIRCKIGLHLHGHVPEARGYLPAFGHYPMTFNSSIGDKNRSVICNTAHVIKCFHMMDTVDKATFFSANSEQSLSSRFGAWSYSIDDLEVA